MFGSNENPFEQNNKKDLSYLIMTHAEYANVAQRPPYNFTLRQEGAHLEFIGSEHSHDIENPMFEDIKNKIIEQKPDVVLIEGFKKINTFSQEQINTFKELKLSHPDWEKEIISEYGEPGFAASVAFQNNIEVYSPEVSDKEITDCLLEKGYTKEEIFGYYFFRQMSSFVRVPDESREDTRQYMQRFIESFKEDTQWKDFNYSIDSAKDIQEDLYGIRELVINKDFYINMVDPVPWESTKEHQTVINKIGSDVSDIRDTYILQKITELKEQSKNIMIIFGATHAQRLEPALNVLYSA